MAASAREAGKGGGNKFPPRPLSHAVPVHLSPGNFRQLFRFINRRLQIANRIYQFVSHGLLAQPHAPTGDLIQCAIFDLASTPHHIFKLIVIGVNFFLHHVALFGRERRIVGIKSGALAALQHHAIRFETIVEVLMSQTSW